MLHRGRGQLVSPSIQWVYALLTLVPRPFLWVREADFSIASLLFRIQKTSQTVHHDPRNP